MRIGEVNLTHFAGLHVDLHDQPADATIPFSRLVHGIRVSGADVEFVVFAAVSGIRQLVFPIVEDATVRRQAGTACSSSP